MLTLVDEEAWVPLQYNWWVGAIVVVEIVGYGGISTRVGGGWGAN
jgi:hypothetical protein